MLQLLTKLFSNTSALSCSSTPDPSPYALRNKVYWFLLLSKYCLILRITLYALRFTVYWFLLLSKYCLILRITLYALRFTIFYATYFLFLSS